ncbi:MAG: pilus assembly protein [Novosphingobium sp.]|nr:pilus assembly protein [Novosphingobium sp.]
MMPAVRFFGRDTRGVTLIEFALIAPALLIALMGLMDLGYNLYTNAQLQGAIQKAARDSTIEDPGSRVGDLDNRVAEAVRVIAPHSTMQFDRSAYSNFRDVAQPEDFTDTNDNGVCDAGEPFEDANGNGTWDNDRGNAGPGGARDAVLYTVTVDYERLFPVARLIGLDGNFRLVAVTVLRNQPYGLQAERTEIGNCA